MGRPRTPTKLHVLRGTNRKDRQNPAEPTPPPAPTAGQAPSWLSPKARPWWKRIRPLLVRMQVLSAADTIALGLLCDALAEYIEARNVLVKHGTTYETTTTDGSLLIRRRPEWDIAKDAWRRAKLMATEFGLTPAARAKVSASDVGPADPLEAWEQGEATT